MMFGSMFKGRPMLTNSLAVLFCNGPLDAKPESSVRGIYRSYSYYFVEISEVHVSMKQMPDVPYSFL